MPKKKKATHKAVKEKEYKWDGAVSKVRSFCVTAAVVLIYVLALVSALHQELSLYAMELNVATSKSAETIIEDEFNRGGEVLESVERVELKAPMGTGNYVALFENNEVWVVSEMSASDSLAVISLFSLLDLATYCMTLIIARRNHEKHPVGCAALCIYQSVFIMLAWVVHAYSLGLLFDLSWVAHLYTLIRMVVCVLVVLCTFGDEDTEDLKSRVIRGK